MTVLWTPPPARIENSHLYHFLAVQGFARDGAVDYAGAHAWSLTDPGAFWSAVWRYCDVIGEMGETAYAPGPDMRSTRFFPDARLNFAENMLRRADEGPAIIAHGEDGRVTKVSWAELQARSAGFAAWLTEMGVEPGDRVAALLPNIPETVIALLGATRIGAVFASASPDFGPAGILDRFGQIDPKVFVASDGYHYNGKTFDIRDKVAEVRAAMPALAATVVVPYLGLGGGDDMVPWADVIADADTPPPFARLPFDHPLYILFSSGTTGKPKCMVHGAGGTLLQHVKEHQLHSDIKAGDRVFYFTTCGWMMWNWLVSALASEAALILYDGSPFYPDGNRLFDMAEAEAATFFGVSAKYIDAVKDAGLKPVETHDLSVLKTLSSTGSPLAPEGFDFVYDAIKPDVHLASISGGTDIVSGFVLGNPCAPVHRGEIQCAGLGMAVEVWDDSGQRIIGTPGELVCTRAFPSMPVTFWNDPDGAKYHSAYFDRFPGVWCHGDFAVETENGGFVILGRSDATLNPGGVRIGTAEIYRQVETIAEVAEALAVGQTWADSERIVLFVVMKDGATLTDDLREKIKTRIRDGASPRHVPSKIIAVPDIPRTRSGKISELAVKRLIHGRAVQNTEALANPEALGYFENLTELQT